MQPTAAAEHCHEEGVHGVGEMCALGPRGGGGCPPAVRRLARWRDAPSHRARSNNAHVVDLHRHASDMGLSSSVARDAASLFMRAVTSVPRAHRKPAWVAAALFQACKHAGAPRGAGELARRVGAPETQVRRSCLQLAASLGLSGDPPCAPAEFAPRLGSALGLSRDQVCALAADPSLQEARCGRSPVLLVGARVLTLGLAGAVDVAAAAGVSALSLQKAVDRLSENSVRCQHGRGRV